MIRIFPSAELLKSINFEFANKQIIKNLEIIIREMALLDRTKINMNQTVNRSRAVCSVRVETMLILLNPLISIIEKYTEGHCLILGLILLMLFNNFSKRSKIFLPLFKSICSLFSNNTPGAQSIQKWAYHAFIQNLTGFIFRYYGAMPLKMFDTLLKKCASYSFKVLEPCLQFNPEIIYLFMYNPILSAPCIKLWMNFYNSFSDP